MTKKVIKRCGKTVDFDRERIIIAISKAMKEIGKESNVMVPYNIANDIESTVGELTSIEEIEEAVYFKLIETGFSDVAKAYERYRAIHEYQRMIGSIEGIVDGTNIDVLTENSNKDGVIASTQRDLIAGEVSRYYTMNKRGVLTPRVKHAIVENWIKFHDSDYHIQKIHNCCLINLEDMLDNGTVINKRKIDSPSNFLTACTVTTQIIAAVTSGQYGGATITVEPLAKYLYRSYTRALKRFSDMKDKEEIARRIQRFDLEAGIQTLNYQLNTLATTNGVW